MALVAHKDRIARILGGRFRVVRLLGEGSLAEVYEADDLLLGERVAVKRLLPTWARDPRLVERCKQEVLAARRISHPNVCRVFDLLVAGDGTGDREVLLTMELVPGETLADRLERRERLPAAEVLPIAEQLCAALEAAHGAGVVHRDLKPANVLLAPDPAGGDRVVVTDFGLARCLAASAGVLTATGDLLGTPAYAAPEQVRGEAVTPAADLFSLGILLYELLTGTLPFEGATAFETAMARLHRTPPAPGSIVAGLDPRWDRAILRCLALDPAERFARAGDVVEALAGRERPEPVRPRPALQPMARAASLAALLLLAGGLAVGFRSHGASPAAGLAARASGAPEPAAAAPPAEAQAPAADGALSAEPTTDYDALFTAAGEQLYAGELGRAGDLYAEILARARDAGEEGTLARALAGLGVVHAYRGEVDQAERLNRQALWHFRQLGDLKGTAVAQINLGAVLVRAGRLREAEALYRAAAVSYATLEQSAGRAAALNNRAELLLRQGHLEEAERLYLEALGERRAAGDPRGEALTLLGLARLDLERSLVGSAEDRSDLALELFTREGRADGVLEALLVRAEAALARGAPAEARKLLEPALRDDHGPPGRRRTAAQVLLSAAALAEGAPERAESLALGALAAAEETFDAEGRTRALLALGGALEGSGRHAEALRVLDRARDTEWGRQDRRLQLRLAVATARAEAGAGRHAEAGRRLRSALQEARWSGLERLSGEIRQALDATEPNLTANLAADLAAVNPPYAVP